MDEDMKRISITMKSMIQRPMELVKKTSAVAILLGLGLYYGIQVVQASGMFIPPRPSAIKAPEPEASASPSPSPTGDTG
jgi:hypothetical protein